MLVGDNDFIVVSFWIVAVAMLAVTIFFYAEAGPVTSHWKSFLQVGAAHYKYVYTYIYIYTYV